MTKHHKKHRRSDAQAAPSTHFDNLMTLRADNPQAYERLGDETHKSVERYELEQLASDFEYRAGMERVLELKDRLPNVYASFSEEMRKSVEAYAQRRHAHQFVTEDK